MSFRIRNRLHIRGPGWPIGRVLDVEIGDILVLVSNMRTQHHALLPSELMTSTSIRVRGWFHSSIVILNAYRTRYTVVQHGTPLVKLQGHQRRAAFSIRRQMDYIEKVS